MKKLVSSFLAVSLLLGGASVVGAEATQDKSVKQEVRKANKEAKQQEKWNKAIEAATKLGLTPDGLTLEQLKAAIEAKQEEKKQQLLEKLTAKAFSETLRTNTSLIRRKIKDPNLWLETKQIGRVTKTEIAIMYIKGIVNDKVVKEVRTRLDQIDIDFKGLLRATIFFVSTFSLPTVALLMIFPTSVNDRRIQVSLLFLCFGGRSCPNLACKRLSISGAPHGCIVDCAISTGASEYRAFH